MPLTLFERIWRAHAVIERDDGQTLLYVDRHLLQDGSAPAFAMLRQRGLEPRMPGRAFATPDHYIPTDSRDLARIADPEYRRTFSENIPANARLLALVAGVDRDDHA